MEGAPESVTEAEGAAERADGCSVDLNEVLFLCVAPCVTSRFRDANVVDILSTVCDYELGISRLMVGDSGARIP